ncbi:hypothetical protein P3T36_001335 [Kitasatospora sp. MAP12-15]|uniref:hypothetical protein n=1 Tax=unclassified Kitasatospora TaxID=2633591 RepID=UPI002475D4E9|nr:hypothetical protein [Kitasatospora sp. MAP12-44]MDH6112452.1 hypothetical protein [Kitasatospora sp. MAP12-44]
MSETIGSPLGGTPVTGLKSATDPERAPRPGSGGLTAAPPSMAARPRPGVDTVQEAYSFACLSCAYGWEQAYDIEHHRARDGHTVIQYHANGVRVPSPLLQPSCPGCGGHTVRIMRAGRVATAEHSVHHAPGFATHGEPAAPLVTESERRPRPVRLRWYQFWLPKH